MRVIVDWKNEPSGRANNAHGYSPAHNDSGANLSIGRLHQVSLQTNLGRMADLVSRNIYLTSATTTHGPTPNHKDGEPC